MSEPGSPPAVVRVRFDAHGARPPTLDVRALAASSDEDDDAVGGAGGGGAATPLARQESADVEHFFDLLSARTPLAAQRAEATTELHAAVSAADVPRAVALLATAGGRAAALRRSAGGYTPLMCAAALEDESAALRLMRALLDAGADVAATDDEGYGSLHWAAVRGGGARCAALVAAGADVHARAAPSLETPLHRAARFGRADAVAVLLRAGADARARTRACLAPLDVAGRYDGAPPSAAHRAAAATALLAGVPGLRTGLLWHADCLRAEARPGHQEAPERVTAILSRLVGPGARFAAGELAVCASAPPATAAQVLRAHSPAYWKLLRGLARHVERRGGGGVPFTPMVQRGLRLASPASVKAGETSDTTFGAGTLPAALRAAGAACAAVDAVVARACRHALCVVRPPGHHAGVNGLLTDLPSTVSCGFCVLNSVGIAALHALAAHPDTIRRVAIVDLDVHHGNGTEEIVRRWAEAQRAAGDTSRGLFFFSSHLYDVERRPAAATSGGEASLNDGGGGGGGAAGDAGRALPPARMNTRRAKRGGGAAAGGADGDAATSAGADAAGSSDAVATNGGGRRGAAVSPEDAAGPTGSAAGPAVRPGGAPADAVTPSPASEAASGTAAGAARAPAPAPPPRMAAPPSGAGGPAGARRQQRGKAYRGGSRTAAADEELELAAAAAVVVRPPSAASASASDAAARVAGGSGGSVGAADGAVGTKRLRFRVAAAADVPGAPTSSQPATVPPQPPHRATLGGGSPAPPVAAVTHVVGVPSVAVGAGSVGGAARPPSAASGGANGDDGDVDAAASPAVPSRTGSGAGSGRKRRRREAADVTAAPPSPRASDGVTGAVTCTVADGSAAAAVAAAIPPPVNDRLVADLAAALAQRFPVLRVTNATHAGGGGDGSEARGGGGGGRGDRRTRGATGAAPHDATVGDFAASTPRTRAAAAGGPGAAAAGAARDHAHSSHARGAGTRGAPGVVAATDASDPTLFVRPAGISMTPRATEWRGVAGVGASPPAPHWHGGAGGDGLRPSAWWPSIARADSLGGFPAGGGVGFVVGAGGGGGGALVRTTSSAGFDGDGFGAGGPFGGVGTTLAGGCGNGVGAAAAGGTTGGGGACCDPVGAAGAALGSRIVIVGVPTDGPLAPSAPTALVDGAPLPRMPGAADATGAGAQPLPSDDADVISTAFYPGTGEEDCLEANVINAPIAPLWRLRPEQKARQRNPLRATVGRLAVRRLVAQRLVPSLRAFGPDLILVSAGFDAAAGDVGNTRADGKATPGLNLLPSDFAWITAQILAVARVCCPGRVVSVLEGGYGTWKRAGGGPGGGAGSADTAPGAADAWAAAAADVAAGGGEPAAAVGAAAAAASAGWAGAPRPGGAVQLPPLPVPPPRLVLRRDMLADCAAEHLRALVDDGACLDADALEGDVLDAD